MSLTEPVMSSSQLRLISCPAAGVFHLEAGKGEGTEAGVQMKVLIRSSRLHKLQSSEQHVK